MGQRGDGVVFECAQHVHDGVDVAQALQEVCLLQRIFADGGQSVYSTVA